MCRCADGDANVTMVKRCRCDDGDKWEDKEQQQGSRGEERIGKDMEMA